MKLYKAVQNEIEKLNKEIEQFKQNKDHYNFLRGMKRGVELGAKFQEQKYELRRQKKRDKRKLKKALKGEAELKKGGE